MSGSAMGRDGAPSRLGAGASAPLAALAAASLLCVPLAAQAPAGPQETPSGPGLVLVNLGLLDSRDGYAIPDDSRFLPGETLHIYFQIDGYAVGEADRVLLRYRLQALDPDGRRFYMAEGGEIDTELAPQDENWMPVVRYSPKIPQYAGGGTYSIRIEVSDALAETAVSAELAVLVDGDRVPTAGELLVRNFRFARSEGGPALDEPVFSPGEEVWASFFITGYETREDNTYKVESDAWVLDGEGRRMFSFESRGQEGNPFYPRLWLPARIRLDLERTAPPGRYTVVLRLRDRVGGSDATHRYAFRIREL